jgi:hypothetical protein
MGFRLFPRPVSAPNFTATGTPTSTNTDPGYAGAGFTGDGSGLTGISNAGIDPTLGQYVQVSLTAAQINALHTAPVSLLAAIAGRVIIVTNCAIKMVTTSTAFTSGGAVAPVYHGATTALTANTLPASDVTAGAGTNYFELGAGAPANGIALTAATGIDLYAATANFATGTGTMQVTLSYYTIPA